MKTKLLLIVALFSTGVVCGQISNLQGNPTQMIRTTKKDNIEGNKFLFETYKNCIVKSKSGESFNTLLKFDMLKNNFIAYNDNGGTIILDKNEYDVFQFNFFDGESNAKVDLGFKSGYEVPEFGSKYYFQVLYDGKDYKVLKAYDTEIVVSGGNAGSGYGVSQETQKKYNTTERYFVVNSDDVTEIKNKKGSVVSYFKADSDKLKDFVKANKLKFKSDEDITQVFQYFENFNANHSD